MKLKVNFQKIIAVVVSTAVITFSFVSVSAFADSESSMTNKEYYASQAYLVAKYKDGKISYSEFQQQTQAITDEFVSKNTVGGVLHAGALNASNTFNAVAQKIGSTVQKYGESARDYINDYISDFFNSYTVLSDKPTTDLKGYGAAVEATLINTPTYANGSDDATYRQLESCDYVVILGNGSYRLCSSSGTYLNEFYTYFDGHLHMSTSYKTIVKIRSEYRTYKFYGDIRYEDGTQAPTDDTYETISDYDFSHASDKDLEDLLKKILNEMELKEPDLSTMEGLLKAIYARLGTLDSDNDNTLLSQILSAIEAIELKDIDNSDLLKILEDLKDSLVYDDGENSETISEQLKKIIDNQLTVDDFTIDEELYNNRMEVLQLRLMGKFSFIHDLSDFVTYIFDSYSNSSDNPEINFIYDDKSYSVNVDYYKDVLPLVQCIIAAFIYISYAYHTYRKIPSYINGGDNE